MNPAMAFGAIPIDGLAGLGQERPQHWQGGLSVPAVEHRRQVAGPLQRGPTGRPLGKDEHPGLEGPPCDDLDLAVLAASRVGHELFEKHRGRRDEEPGEIRCGRRPVVLPAGRVGDPFAAGVQGMARVLGTEAEKRDLAVGAGATK